MVGILLHNQHHWFISIFLCSRLPFAVELLPAKAFKQSRKCCESFYIAVLLCAKSDCAQDDIQNSCNLPSPLEINAWDTYPGAVTAMI